MAQVTREEFTRYIEENSEKFYRLAWTYVKNEEDALDIVQDAIFRALKSFHTIKKSEYLGTWFYRVLVNESLMYLRKNKNRGSVLSINEEVLCDSHSIDNLGDKELLWIIENLPPDLKTVIYLRFYENMRISEIASITKTNINTVKTRLYRSLRLLKLEIEDNKA